MPVYRKGKRLPPKRALPKDRQSIRRDRRGRRVLGPKVRYKVSENSGLDRVERALSFPLIKEIRRRRKPVVVDWGCGKGKAIAELAERFSDGRFYGFSREFYSKWRKHKERGKQGVKFIHAEANDFGRYFKDKTVDIIFSRLGLVHIANRPDYFLRQIIPALKPGGLLVFDTNFGAARLRLLRALLQEPGLRVYQPNPYTILVEKKAK